jgi:cold shock CspA family protein
MERYTGVVLRYSLKTGYGFIALDRSTREIYVHASDIGMVERLTPRQRVSFIIAPDRTKPDKLRARDVRLIARDCHAPAQ